MVEGLEKVDDLYLSILALLPRDHKKVNEAFARRVKKLATAIEHQEKRYGVLSSVSDTVQENLDKMRLECKNALYECEKLSNEVKEAERKRREFLLMFSNRDSEQKTRLSQIRSELQMYESILQVGIEELDDGKSRGVIFKPKSFAYCDLDDGDKEGADKYLNSNKFYSKLNSIYHQLEISEQWKHFL